MAGKVDAAVFARLVELKTKYGLTNAVIAERLGISPRTVKVYWRAHRLSLKPYVKPQDVSPHRR